MPELTLAALVIPSFFAGILTFLAPCTLPLVPGYLGFISGASVKDLSDPGKVQRIRGKVFLNGLFYVIGFSLVFIVLGTLFGLGGAALIQYRVWLGRIGGIFVILFGLYMLNVFSRLPFLSFLNSEHQFRFGKALKPGNPVSSLIFGSAFAFGWTPCVGPVLGSILLLASASTTVGQGALLLAVFSAGLAIPFLLIALGIGHATHYIQKMSKILHWTSIIGGIFLIFLGVLLVTDRFALWLSYAYRLFGFINYDRILDYL
ncbi:MAG: sulfite exporter TauE/SafE family protein [Parcubacteria group bacterium]|nr:sulfite exporter TauE/SafE family protein [Parcubacteria group bacterium]